MSTHRNIDKICVVVLVLVLLLTVVFMNGKKFGLKVIADEDAESYSGSTYFTENDKDGDWADNAYTTYITLDDSGGKIDGNGAYFLNGNLVISNGGWYVISGTLEDGGIVVDAHNSSKIWIRLNGVTINCSEDACLRINQADKVFLTLAEGTENSFTSGSSYSEDALSDNTGGTIFSHDDLTINGSGSLTVTAGYKHGIDVNDSLVITGGNITVNAPQDGIHVNDSFRFMNATLTVNVGDDGVHSDDELYIESGTVRIASCYEGLEATTIDIVGGDITIHPSDDGINANGGRTMGFREMGGGTPPNNMGRPDNSGDTKGTATSQSSSEEEIPKQPGTAQTQEGISSDDKETYIRISGGTLTIINETGRDADGLDSNGSIYIDGGDILISLVGDGSNCAIDYGSESGGECIVNGGTILAFGGAGMVEEFSSKCTQCSVLYNIASSVQAQTLFRVLNEDGKEIFSYTPQCSYSSVSFSAPNLTVGETCTIVCGQNSTELTLDSTAVSVGKSGNKGGMPPGGMMERGSESFAKENGESPSNHPTPLHGEMRTPPQQNGVGSLEPPDHSDKKTGSSSESTETDGNRINNERPSPPNGDGGGMKGFNPGSSSNTEGTKTASDGFLSLEELDANVWILLGSSLLILAVAILFAKKYRKNRY